MHPRRAFCYVQVPNPELRKPPEERIDGKATQPYIWRHVERVVHGFYVESEDNRATTMALTEREDGTLETIHHSNVRFVNPTIVK